MARRKRLIRTIQEALDANEATLLRKYECFGERPHLIHLLAHLAYKREWVVWSFNTLTGELFSGDYTEDPSRANQIFLERVQREITNNPITEWGK